MAFFDGYSGMPPFAAGYGFGGPAFPAAVGPFAAAAAAAPGVVSAPGMLDEVRTVFITGFPNDIKERELNNLLRFIPGYEASQMNWKNGQAQGFALFVTGAAARAACDQIAGLCFDDNVLLRAEMAHKNMYIKGEAAPVAVGGKRMRTTGGYSGSYSGGGGSIGGAASGPLAYQPVSNTRDNPPCNTLFIGNLGDAVDDVELQALFTAQPGFAQIKVLRSGRNISCFVEFDTVESASLCHTTQQGAVLRSSDRGGIRIQFSKNPFGKKRDAGGQLVDARSSGGGGGSAAGVAPGLEGMPSVGGAYDPAAAANTAA